MEDIRKGAGLFMFTKIDEIYLILLNKPYEKCKIKSGVNIPPSYKALSTVKTNQFFNYGFLEKFSIPRGQPSKTNREESSLLTAIREFLEETQINLKSFKLLNTNFNLKWTDDSGVKTKHYSYTIYIGFVNITTYYEPFTHELDIKELYPNIFHVGVTEKTNRYEAHYQIVCKMRFHDYIRYMKNYQLEHYTYSNYLDFFNFTTEVLKWKKNQSPDDLFDNKLIMKKPIFFSADSNNFSNHPSFDCRQFHLYHVELLKFNDRTDIY